MNVGRNDPCPCGSGKKFKKCCIDIYEMNHSGSTPVNKAPRSLFLEYLREHETRHVLNLIIALQLIPENYGKNYRIELMANEAVRNLSEKGDADLTKLRTIIAKEFPSHYAEDLPEELFTENVLFHGGNYTVMPGINSYCADIFKYLSAAIYITRNDFSEGFKRDLQQGVSLVLNLGSILFEQAQLKRYSFVKSFEEELKFPKKLPRLSFTTEELIAICDENKIDPHKIENFTTRAGSAEFTNNNDPSVSPLVYRPFVQLYGDFFMVLPSCQLSAINEYILKMAKQYGARNEIHRLCHEMIWHDIWEACDKMGWLLTDISLPALPPLPIKERIFQFDAYMLAYVCYAFPAELKDSHEMYTEPKDISLNGDALNKRTEAVITELKSRKELEGYQFLTVILTNSMGGFFAMGFEQPQENELKTWFNAFDFLNLAYAGEWDRLDLWKYAKVYESTTEEARIMATSQVDAYATYKRNGETFYLSDESRFNLLTIVPGDGADITREAKIKLDVHGALCKANGSLAYQEVRQYRDYAPIYKPIKQNGHYEMLLESYRFPIWIQNFEVKNDSEANYVEQLADTICFWLHRLYPRLSEKLNLITSPLLNIILELDQTFFQPMSLDDLDLKEVDEFKLLCSYAQHNLTVKFPKGIRKYFIGGDNAGERIFIRELLKGFNAIPNMNLSDQFIIDALNLYMPLGQAKMMLLLDTRTDLQLDNRWLLPTLYISDAEVNLLLDKLVSIVNSQQPIPKKIQSIDDKKRFCNQVVLRLTQYLSVKLKEFNGESLINRLIDLNERLIHNREFSKIKTSAQIHCFGNDEKELEKILKREKKLVNTSLATRCLIEFIVLVPTNGHRKPSFDQLDELLAIMNEILNYGLLSDTIHFGMANPEIGLLPSGRIGISKEFYDQKLQPFHKDNTIANIEAQLESFSSQFETYSSKPNSIDTNTFFDKVDDAFLKDWGIDFTNLTGICRLTAEMAARKEDSVISMHETDLIAELKRIMSGAEDQVEIGLKKLRLEYDPKIISDEKGYTSAEYFPWKYNREFSYARRPFVVVNTERGKMYYWGMRQCVAASQYLLQLLHSGRLNFGGGRINELLGEIRKNNGKRFRNSVALWLKENTALIVWDFEVSVKPNGHFNSDRNYGDCDVLAYNPNTNRVYNIECKRTEAARNVQQMKNEMDSYLGRAGQKKKIAKHEERDSWLQANLDQVRALVGASESPKVKSLIITSDLIPTRYIRSGEIPLPIISYRELRNGGLASLEKL